MLHLAFRAFRGVWGCAARAPRPYCPALAHPPPNPGSGEASLRPCPRPPLPGLRGVLENLAAPRNWKEGGGLKVEGLHSQKGGGGRRGMGGSLTFPLKCFNSLTLLAGTGSHGDSEMGCRRAGESAVQAGLEIRFQPSLKN